MFDCAVVNAYILWKTYKPLTEVAPRQQSLKNFHLSVANGLITSYNSRQRYNVPVPIKEASLHSSCSPKKRARLSGTPSTSSTVQHFPIKGRRGKCNYCWNIRGERHITTSLQKLTDTRRMCGVNSAGKLCA